MEFVKFVEQNVFFFLFIKIRVC